MVSAFVLPGPKAVFTFSVWRKEGWQLPFSFFLFCKMLFLPKVKNWKSMWKPRESHIWPSACHHDCGPAVILGLLPENSCLSLICLCSSLCTALTSWCCLLHPPMELMANLQNPCIFFSKHLLLQGCRCDCYEQWCVLCWILQDEIKADLSPCHSLNYKMNAM